MSAPSPGLISKQQQLLWVPMTQSWKLVPGDSSNSEFNMA